MNKKYVAKLYISFHNWGGVIKFLIKFKEVWVYVIGFLHSEGERCLKYHKNYFAQDCFAFEWWPYQCCVPNVDLACSESRFKTTFETKFKTKLGKNSISMPQNCISDWTFWKKKLDMNINFWYLNYIIILFGVTCPESRFKSIFGTTENILHLML